MHLRTTAAREERLHVYVVKMQLHGWTIASRFSVLIGRLAVAVAVAEDTCCSPRLAPVWHRQVAGTPGSYHFLVAADMNGIPSKKRMPSE